jgi:O-acetyl-ADP-ribose deacetylase (regulator of RNase III)
MEREVNGGVTVEIVEGDISSQDDIDAVVNAANAELTSGGGVAGAIHQAAGSGLAEESRPLSPIQPGEAVITGGHEHELLAQCYRNALSLAEEHDLKSVAFPSISTGAFGYPAEEAAEVALRAVLESAENLQSVRRIRFVLYGEENFEVYERVLLRLL